MNSILLLVLIAVPTQSRFEERVIQLVNHERMLNGIAPLEYSEQLSDAADLWVKLCHGQLAHYLLIEDCWTSKRIFAPDIDGDGYCNVWERQVACGWMNSGSEAGASNANDPEWIVNAWMQSPSHRNGLLNPWWTHAGVSSGFGVTYMEVGGP